MKQSIFVFLILLVPIIAFGQTPADLRKHVDSLAAFNGRETGSGDDNKAAVYLKTTLEDSKITITYQGFSYRNKQSQNVLAQIGKGTTVIVVGAHYDGQGRGKPSADDNASGCAMALELAKNIKKTPAWTPVLFIFFAGEEEGLIGSQFYTDHPLYPLKDHKFMINLDMVGHLKVTKLNGPEVSEILGLLYKKYPFAQAITLRGVNDDSDNTSFRKKGIPFAFIHTGLTNTYHKATDTPDSLNYEGMVEITKYVEELIRSVAIVPEI